MTSSKFQSLFSLSLKPRLAIVVLIQILMVRIIMMLIFNIKVISTAKCAITHFSNDLWVGGCILYLYICELSLHEKNGAGTSKGRGCAPTCDVAFDRSFVCAGGVHYNRWSVIVQVQLFQWICCSAIVNQIFEVHDEVIERFRGATGGYMKKLEKGQHIELLSELINYNCEVRSTFVGKVIFFQKSRSDVWSRATWNHLLNTCSLARARALSWVSDCLPFFLLSMYILKHRWT